ncbi:unnamed protein product, partial [Discosporangium mesarthrocarpum]
TLSLQISPQPHFLAPERSQVKMADECATSRPWLAKPLVSLSSLALCLLFGGLTPSFALDEPDVLSALFHPVSLETFVTEFWEQKPMVIRNRGWNHYEGIFSLQAVDEVIEKGINLSDGSHPMHHGSDWVVIKRVFREEDGEYWTAHLPSRPVGKDHGDEGGAVPTGVHDGSAGATLGVEDKARGGGGGGVGESGATGGGGASKSLVSLEDAHVAFGRLGFSVVINQLQRRWRRVAEVCLPVEEALGHPVNVNMYLTPWGHQGFESHFDSMDGIILQLSGRKVWRLFNRLVDKPRVDMKYKPRSRDL